MFLTTKSSAILVACLFVAVSAKSTVAPEATKTTQEATANKTSDSSISNSVSPDQNIAQNSQENLNATSADDEDEALQYPFRDLPADVLRDFPGLCFGSTALRLFQIGQSWSLSPFCGVATCLVSEDGYHLIERVQDCGPQPVRNARCRNINEKFEAAFPDCCPKYACEEGAQLEYPTQKELRQLAQEAADAAVRAQYEDDDYVAEEGRSLKSIEAEEDEAEEPKKQEEKEPEQKTEQA